MALFKHRSETEAAPFKERRTKGRLVAFNADVVAAPVPSPAHALQAMLVERTSADGFILDPAERRRALIRFVGAFVLLWGGSAAALAMMMVVSG